MTQKRKISVRKVLQFLVTIIVTAGCIVAISSASKLEDGKFINNIDIQIRNERKCRFIDKGEVLDILVNSRHADIKHIPVSKLDLHSMEQIVSTNPWVANAEIYVDNVHDLHVNLTQRVPVARVFEEDGNSYYLDTALKAMPLSDRYIYYTTVVTNVPVVKDDSAGIALRAQVLEVVRFVENSNFWKAQVSQIIMLPDSTFELVPVLGHQRILLGDTSMLGEKFGNLYAFYKNVSNRIGWDKYDVIDLRYKGQVVASPALPWKAPVDKAMSSMNWVKNIVGKDINTTEAAVPVSVPAAPKPQPASPEHAMATSAMGAVTERAKPVKTEVRAGVKAQAHTPPAKAPPPPAAKKMVQAEKKELKKDPVTKKAAPNEKKEEGATKEQTPKYLYKANNDNH